MKKIGNFSGWIFRNFFFITSTIFVVIYLRWFQLTPLVFEYYNDPNDGYIFGVILLFIFLLAIVLLHKINSNNYKLRFVVGLLAITLLIINSLFVYWFSPSMVTKAKCNGAAYYITTSRPLSDPQWRFYQFTKWQGYFDYETFFYGYSGWKYKIVCDEAQNEANIVIPAIDALDYTDGENSRSYIPTSARLNNRLYVLSEDWFIPEDCNKDKPWDCDTFIYTLYECKSNYTACHSLPINYKDKDEKFAYLESDISTNEVKLYDSENDTVIFIYGENPRCYVEGCEVLEQ